ncbi:DUF4142 domain-containing protein [Adhaeribacter soli]|uniref:DUF4142 domain-containing protein n=1 Tax=Adhaeribacter soli TaxID=2607655 RepID=A0A5N1J0N2_9BACT|nr:DUF4142 domain-containing protein [Adhaeribacter soli]KAA9340190.1 DUF4142 domain-containing protein [Adhaeribacter soli]
MKRCIPAGLLVVSLLLNAGCEKAAMRKDSIEIAEEENKARENDSTMNVVREDQVAFMVRAASANMMEVEAGRLAEKLGSNVGVKAFGKSMVNDHTKANQELKEIAAAKNIALPTTVGNEDQKYINKLSKLSGPEFDKEYISMMVKDHRKDTDHFRRAAKDEEFDPEVRTFAGRTLPVVERHLEKARQLDEAIRKAK